MTAADWQSPSVLHAVHSAAGRFTGEVTEHVDDYKRDRHADAERFERAYLDEYVGPGRPGDLRALMTSCGMSAFATILAYLRMEATAGRTALVGRSVYHECRDLLARGGLGGSVVEVDETRPETVLCAVAEHRPGALFLDSLCNAKGVVVPDLTRIVDGLARAGQDVVLVVDNTALSCAFDPMTLVPDGSALRMIVFESLTKYAQLGLDRTPAGMIAARGPDAEALDRYREHLGANVSDAAACMMPWPNRPVLHRRLGRLGRNALLLASAFDQHVKRGGGLFGPVDHPGLAHHPSFPVARDLSFQGGFFGVGLRPPYDRPDHRRRFVWCVIEEARAAGTPVAAGPSFGLNTTRVYHTTSSTELGRPFVRISAGTEHRLEVEALTGVITRAADRLARSCGRL
jgi:cystathionine beta-lyase/cystathionine gamma-synthase